MKSRQVPAVNIEVMRDGAQSQTGSTRSLNHQIATAPGVLHAKFGEVDVGQAFAFWGLGQFQRFHITPCATQTGWRPLAV